MPARRKPRVLQEDIDRAVDDLLDVLCIDQLSDVDRFFALDLLQDYGKWCGISEAAWRSIIDEGITERVTTGGRGNNHHKMVKSESIAVFKDARTAKTDLAMKISKLVKNGSIVQEEEDELAAFNS